MSAGKLTNIYGSAIEEGSESSVSADTEASAIEPNSHRKTCICNTICSRKSGKKPGCPCRDAKLSCCEECLCGKKAHGSIIRACTNGKVPQNGSRKEPLQRKPHGDGFDQLREEQQKSKEEVKQYLQTQEKEVLEERVLEIACTGKGSFNFIKNMVDFIKNEHQQPEDEDNAPAWCSCKVCRPLPKEEENNCCGKRTCVTSYQMFAQCIINRDVLELAIKYHCDTRAEDFDFSTNAMRKAAYRQFTMWKYGRLGKSNRKPNPACVVRMIREAYPSPTNEYMGYKES